MAENYKAKAEQLLRDWKGDSYTFGVDVLDAVGKYAAQYGKSALVLAGEYGVDNGWMKDFLGGTESPISMLMISFALTTSSMLTWRTVLEAGFMVVCHSCSGFISPNPLYRCISTFLLPFMRARIVSFSFSV